MYPGNLIAVAIALKFIIIRMILVLISNFFLFEVNLISVSYTHLDVYKRQQ